MSYPTTPAYVVDAQGWDENLLKHPMARFMLAHEAVFDAKDIPACAPYYHPSLVYTKSTGQSFTGQAAINQMHADYALFAAFTHEPVHGVFVDTPNGGHTLFGHARIFVDLPGASDATRTEADLSGRKWECRSEGAFRFEVVKDEDGPLGYRMKSMSLFADPSGILKVAVKRGLIPVEALT
ncbi:hypothetical protein QBC47DRAFT_392813, partial [Echria macrotheca]